MVKTYISITVKPTVMTGGMTFRVGEEFREGLAGAQEGPRITEIDYKRDGNMGARGQSAFVLKLSDERDIVFPAENVAYCAVGDKGGAANPEALDIPDAEEEEAQDVNEDGVG